jgi:hypothetical protein
VLPVYGGFTPPAALKIAQLTTRRRYQASTHSGTISSSIAAVYFQVDVPFRPIVHLTYSTTLTEPALDGFLPAKVGS